MVSIHSEEENDFLTKHTEQIRFWLGAEQVANNLKSFTWSDRSAFNYSSWNDTQFSEISNSAKCRAVSFHLGKWFTSDCSQKYAQLCQKTIENESTNVVDKFPDYFIQRLSRRQNDLTALIALMQENVQSLNSSLNLSVFDMKKAKDKFSDLQNACDQLKTNLTSLNSNFAEERLKIKNLITMEANLNSEINKILAKQQTLETRAETNSMKLKEAIEYTNFSIQDLNTTYHDLHLNSEREVKLLQTQIGNVNESINKLSQSYLKQSENVSEIIKEKSDEMKKFTIVNLSQEVNTLRNEIKRLIIAISCLGCVTFILLCFSIFLMITRKKFYTISNQSEFNNSTYTNYEAELNYINGY
ncbi:Neurocan core protein-like protein [Dinothrombium tinctorium]|uniref:Neurocan core protein-like protein n=1 Tax=Dinothrombium tinctorium TaxID=1965070 RepID=A0A3S3S0M5_9ACAR|nr:Neurocan core protein-like protein [Dinothrombium tinctorium]RWS07526.1 Neurocan core protein-like protein [Dinothrombium tinctorium]RWS11933.1 Neurocan core protein-like protein [Dinothrombium tinctorium]